MNEEPKSCSYSFEKDLVEDFLETNFKDFNLILNKIFKLVHNTNKYFTIYFTSKELIKNLNKNYRNKNSATDVLSFPISDIIEPNYLGEILCCPEVLLQRANIQKQNVIEHFKYMILHSYLHLIGYEHNNEDEYKIIEKETEKLMEKIK